MKKIKRYILPIMLLTALPLIAEETSGAKNDAQADKSANGEKCEFSRLGTGMRMHIIKQFDKDGDGKLNAEERAEAEKALAAKKQKFEEMRKKHAQKIMEKFDKDKDGKLNQEELADLLAEQHKMMAKRGFNKRGGERMGKPKMRQCPKMAQNYACSPCDRPANNRCCEKPSDAPRFHKMHGKRGGKNMGFNQKRSFNRGGERMGPPPAELLAKYDKDGDGKLCPEERQAMHKDMKEKRDALIKKYDKDGDGKLNAEERAELLNDPEVKEHMKKMKEAREKRAKEMKNRPCKEPVPCCKKDKACTLPSAESSK